MKPIPGPDPNPVKPKYVPPPGACDAHNHVFGPAARFPYAPNRSYTPPDSPKEKLAALHRHLGFSRSVLVQASCHGIEQKPFRLLLELMKNELAWVKISGPERVSAAGKPFHDAIPFARALIEAAPDRVLWGTDFPHPNAKVMPNDGELVDLFAAMCDDQGIRAQILVENPTRLYWSDDRRK